MSKAKKHPAASLPKPAPKKTGKKGVGPREFAGDLTEQDAARQEKESPKQPEGEPLKVPPAEGERAKKSPRQRRLPEMEDPKIEELESAAEEYADVRDQRMALTPDETRLKKELLDLMHKHGKTSYVHKNIDIKVIVESEKVKVRIKKEEE
jgi:hypothetical protein